MAKLTEEKIQSIIQAYARIGTYSGVAKELGCSASTVKKYVTVHQATTLQNAPEADQIWVQAAKETMLEGPVLGRVEEVDLSAPTIEATPTPEDIETLRMFWLKLQEKGLIV